MASQFLVSKREFFKQYLRQRLAYYEVRTLYTHHKKDGALTSFTGHHLKIFPKGDMKWNN